MAKSEPKWSEVGQRWLQVGNIGQMRPRQSKRANMAQKVANVPNGGPKKAKQQPKVGQKQYKVPNQPEVANSCQKWPNVTKSSRNGQK